MATTNAAPQHRGNPALAVAMCSSLGAPGPASTTTGRVLASKPRPAKIDTAAASFCRGSTGNYDQAGGQSAPSNRPSQALNAAASPQVHNVHNVASPSSPQLMSPQFPAKKHSMIKSFFTSKMPRCASNSIGPSPSTPISPLALFSYTQSGPSLQLQHGHQQPLTPDSCPSTGKPNYYCPEYLRGPLEYGGGHSHEMMSCQDSVFSLSIAQSTPLSPPEHFGRTCNIPAPATGGGRSTNEHIPKNPVPKRANRDSLGLCNLVIPPYQQLQKRGDDPKRNDTSHLPHPQQVSAVEVCGKPTTPLIQSQNTGPGGEKLTVSAKYLSKHILNPEFARRYQIGDELGSGGFGFVVAARQISDGREVAIKFIHKDKVPVHGWIRDPHLDYIPMEIYVIKNLPHPGVIKFIDMFDDHKFFYLVMELHGTPWTSSNPVLQGSKVDLIKKSSSAPPTTSPASKKGSLLGALNCGMDSASRASPGLQDTYDPQPDLPSQRSRDAPIPPPPRPAMVRRASCDLFECIEHHSKFSENKARLIFRQVVECVHYLNSRGVCHRDIKDENIVIDKDLNVKLIDFGSAVVVNPSGRLFDRFYGTINYASPEILRGEKYQAEAAEIWSLGILLYTLLYGEVPFTDPQQAMYAPYVKPKHQSSPECAHLLNWTLEKSADRRATIEDVFGHPWLVMTDAEMEQARL